MKLRVKDVSHVIVEDIDPELSFDVKELDAAVNTCLCAVSNALTSRVPTGFSEFERDTLAHFVEGLKSSHLSIRKLLSEGHTPSSVDALVIARLQIESLYTFCFLVESPMHIRSFLRNGWKKQYVRFLLGREEWKMLRRANHFYSVSGPDYLEKLRGPCFVSEAEKTWIEIEELGLPFDPTMKASISKFQHRWV